MHTHIHAHVCFVLFRFTNRFGYFYRVELSVFVCDDWIKLTLHENSISMFHYSFIAEANEIIQYRCDTIRNDTKKRNHLLKKKVNFDRMEWMALGEREQVFIASMWFQCRNSTFQLYIIRCVCQHRFFLAVI